MTERKWRWNERALGYWTVGGECGVGKDELKAHGGGHVGVGLTGSRMEKATSADADGSRR